MNAARSGEAACRKGDTSAVAGRDYGESMPGCIVFVG